MKSSRVDRRQLLCLAGSLAASACWPGALSAQTSPPPAAPSPPSAVTLSYCLNTATIRSANLPLPQLVDLVAQAGYDGVELWVRDVQRYEAQGGDLNDLRKRAADAGLAIVNMIGFAAWVVDDDTQRAAGFEAMKRDMDLAARIGCSRIAAPPAGATQQKLELDPIVDRYRALLELGASTGVTPQLELWGSSRTLSRLGELAYVAAETAHPQARVLPDVYHIFKGGSDFTGLRLFSGSVMDLFHINDYPANLPRDEATDADRVFPGDGIAPSGFILRTLRDNGFRGYLSLELFNRQYWEQDPREVARQGLAKMKQVVASAWG